MRPHFDGNVVRLSEMLLYARMMQLNIRSSIASGHAAAYTKRDSVKFFFCFILSNSAALIR